jgi:hypothetical protein
LTKIILTDFVKKIQTFKHKYKNQGESFKLAFPYSSKGLQVHRFASSGLLQVGSSLNMAKHHFQLLPAYHGRGYNNSGIISIIEGFLHQYKGLLPFLLKFLKTEFDLIGKFIGVSPENPVLSIKDLHHNSPK